MTIFGETVYATQAFCYLLDFIYQHNPNLVYKIAEPVIENNCNKLVLANHSLKQLNIIEDDNYKGKYSSVVRMLNDCITSMGKRKFAYNFLNPITDEKLLQNEYNIIEHVLDSNDYSKIKPILIHIKDISKIVRLIMLKKVSPKSLYQLYSGICLGKILYEYIINNPHLSSYLNNKILGFDTLLTDMDSIIHFFNEVFILDEIKEIDNIQKIEKSFIKDGVDSNLDNKMDISIALSYLIDDYNDNAKNLGIIFNCNEKNIIKSINKKLNNIIDDNARDKFNRFYSLKRDEYIIVDSHNLIEDQIKKKYRRRLEAKLEEQGYFVEYDESEIHVYFEKPMKTDNSDISSIEHVSDEPEQNILKYKKIGVGKLITGAEDSGVYDFGDEEN
jgi:DNA mismatch repair ATPase MutS